LVVARSSLLFDWCEKPTSFNYLLIAIREVPADNDAGLAAANNPPSIKLKLKDPSHVGW
jgi:hypothetical protein